MSQPDSSSYVTLACEQLANEAFLDRIAIGMRTVESTSVRHPSGQGRTYRIAMGLFGGFGALSKAVRELAVLGHASDSMCVVGSGSAFSCEELHENLAETPLQCRLLHACLSVSGEPLEASKCQPGMCALLDELNAAISAEPAVSGRLAGLPGSLHSSRIRKHIENGGLVLVVNSSSPEHHDACCRTLLKYVQNGILTHDFTALVRAPR